MNRRSLKAVIALVVGVGALTAAPGVANAAQIVDVAVSQITGTAPFDATSGRGNDTSATDDVVRSNDSITYMVQVNVNDSTASSSTGKNVTVTQTLPAGMAWTRLPATCRTSGLTPASSISPDKSTITCNIGDVVTGKALTVLLSANVTEMADGAVLTPDPNSVSVVTDDAAPAYDTPAPATVTSIPRVDMVKQAPTVSITSYGGVDGYFLTYPVKVEIPSFGSRGLIGYTPPDPVMSLKDNFSAVSPNAEFVSCGPDTGGTWTCPAAGSASPISIDVTLSSPNVVTAATLSSSSVTIFVPKSDVIAANNSLTTKNELQDLVATDGSGNPATGEVPTNNSASLVLSLYPSGNFGVYKHYIDVTNTGRYVPGGSNVDRNGFATVGVGQIFQAEVRISAGNPINGYTSVAGCDVFDSVTQKMTLHGAASSPSYGNGRPAWTTTNTITGGGSFTAGTDFVIEYSNDATNTDHDETARWAALKATKCDTGTWTSTPPATEAAANAVKRVRLRFLTTPPYRYTLAFAINLTAKFGDEHTKIANWAMYNVGAGWIGSNYNPETHAGSRGDRLILTAAQVRLNKDILDPAVGPTVSPSIRGGEAVKYGLRPQVYAPTQTINPGIVTARDVTVTDILPAGTRLSTSAGHEPSPKPTSVTVYSNGTTTLVWHIGNKSSADTPVITYWATVSNTASGTKVNRAMVTSPDDVGSPTKVPSSGSDPHYAARTLNIDSLGGIQVDKAAAKTYIEPRDDITFSVTYANLDPVARNDMDVIDVLPFNGDGTAVGDVPGRNPGSSFHGRVVLKNVDVEDGETVRYTNAAPADVYALYDPSNGAPGHAALPAGKAWCTASEIAAHGTGCPLSISSSTAIRVTRNGPLAALEDRRFTYTLETVGNRSGDIYSNTAALRSSSLKLGTTSATRTTRVVASAIGDLVWFDRNRNGKQDGGREAGVPNVLVTLTGTDKEGRAVRVQTRTDSKGHYLFTSSSAAGQAAGVWDLISGDYQATFHKVTLPKGYGLTKRHVAGVAMTHNSEPYRNTGQTAVFTLTDPTPDKANLHFVIVDAGIVNPPFPPTPPTSTSHFTG